MQEKPSDDMLFYVVENYLQREAETRLFVRRWNAQRKDVPQLESGDGIDWEASYYLNVIVHLSYELEFKIYSKDESASGTAYTELHTKQIPIFASPNRIRVDQDDKAAESQLTFPDIYFSLMDHHMHDRSNAPLAHANEFVSIRLTAHGHFLGTLLPAIELFRGVASHAVVFSAYSKVHSASARADSRRLPFSRRRPPATGHYLALRGPRGKGRAQMSVATSLDQPSDNDNDESDSDSTTAAAPVAPATAGESPTKPAGLMRALLGSFRRATAAAPPPSETAENGETTAQAMPLYCSLTYISIPYDAIVGDCTKAWLLACEPDTTAEVPVEEAK